MLLDSSGDFCITTYYAVVNEDLKIVYRGISMEQCAVYLKPGKLVGNIFAKAESQREADRMALEKMRKLVDIQLQHIRMKAAAE